MNQAINPLALAVTGPKTQPARTQVYGPGGVGKSTLASSWPTPLYIDVEDSCGNIDVARYPFDPETNRTQPRNWSELLKALQVCARNMRHAGYKSLVIDTTNAVERLILAQVRATSGLNDVDLASFNTISKTALPLWDQFLALLETIWRAQRVEIVLLSHAHTVAVRNPHGPDWDQWAPSFGSDDVAQRFFGWCDAVLFAHWKVNLQESGGGRKGKGKGRTPRKVKVADLNDVRVLETRPTGAWRAKNRWNLPGTVPLDYAALVEARKRCMDPEYLADQLRSIAAIIGEEKLAEVEKWLRVGWVIHCKVCGTSPVEDQPEAPQCPVCEVTEDVSTNLVGPRPAAQILSGVTRLRRIAEEQVAEEEEEQLSEAEAEAAQEQAAAAELEDAANPSDLPFLEQLEDEVMEAQS